MERDLAWWLGKSVDANLILRTYAAINLLHGELSPPPSGAKAAEKNAWAELVDRLPPVGHFHKAYSSLVQREEDGVEERWVLLPGFEERCVALYQDALGKGLKLEDTSESGAVVEKGILTVTREFVVEYMRFKADKKAAEAAAKSEAKDALEEQAKEFEDKATQQQATVKSLLEKAREATPEDKAKLEEEAKKAAQVLEEYRKGMRTLVDQAAQVAKEAKAAEQEALDSEKRAEKGTARLEKRRTTGASCPGSARRERRRAVHGQGPGRGPLQHRLQARGARGRAVRHDDHAPQGRLQRLQGGPPGVRRDVGTEEQATREGGVSE